MSKLYPPQLEGSLPAFYKTYEDINADSLTLQSVTINIPFGLSRAVNISAISGIALKLRTTSTNTYLVTDYRAIQFNPETNIATFKFDYDKDNDITASLFNEGQYYRAQLAFIDNYDEIGYYSTVGVIKCVAQPTVELDGFDKSAINTFENNFTGVYKQLTRFGDSTEKAYSYIFNIYDSNGELQATSGELIHDISEDTSSDSSSDRWITYKEFPEGEIYNVQYTVTTINGLVVSSVMYRIMRTTSIDMEIPIQIYTISNFNDGYIEIKLKGGLTGQAIGAPVYKQLTTEDIYDENRNYFVKNQNNEYVTIGNNELQYLQDSWDELIERGMLYIQENSIVYKESAVSGAFLITRASELDNYFEWVDINRIIMVSDIPSELPPIIDRTVEQGVRYKYALQQYNIHEIYSKKIFQTDQYDNTKETTVVADFEDMFLSDGKRQLKIRFNPKVTSFKSTIPEQKIETIGSKYPFIFRNGSVCYKEFPISGLVSYQMDDATFFLNEEELSQAGILEYDQGRGITNFNGYANSRGHEDNGNIVWDNSGYSSSNLSNTIQSNKKNLVRMDKSLTTENIMGERYFKLKVLDWLNDGKIKLFRSPTEGNYLVRLLNVSMSPTDQVGRMLHTFTCTGYEIDELTYDNLIKYGIITPSEISNYEEQWASVDIKQLLQDSNAESESEFIKISPDNVILNGITIQDFAPGDQIKIIYDNGQPNIFVVGVTGSLSLDNDDRNIIEVWFKPNPDAYGDFERSFTYQTTSLQLTKFDAVSDIQVHTEVAQQFVGPQNNLLEPFILRNNAYGVKNEDGIVLNPIGKDEGYQAIYNDIKAHHRFTYKIDEETEKFTGIKLDILSVHKRELIPIFAYDQEISETTNFGITPFGIGYVNNQPIIDYLDDDLNIIYSNPVIMKNENGTHTKFEGVNIKDIDTLLQTEGLKQNVFSVLKTFVYDEEQNKWIPVSDENEYAYYDCYTQSWWEAGTKYNPSFSFNELDTFNDDEIIGDNNIYLNQLNDLTLYNLDSVKHISLCNGVFAEITMQIRVVDYDIEDSNPEVRQAKQDYLNEKNNFEKYLNEYIQNSGSIIELQNNYNKLIQLKTNLEAEIRSYTENLGQKDNVLAAAKSRIIDQKLKVWSVLTQRIRDIVSILQNIKIYVDISAIEPDTYIIDHAQSINDQYLEDIDAANEFALFIKGRANKTPNSEDTQSIFNDENNKIYFQKYSNNTAESSIEQIKIPGTEEYIHNDETDKDYFDIVSNFFYIYELQIDNIIANNQEIISDCLSKIEVLSVQCGELLGGYLSEYNEANLPPENTLVYYEYYINQINQQLENELEILNTEKDNLINELLSAILGADTELLSDYTDKYILSNATKLIAFLLNRITLREQNLKTMFDNSSESITRIIFNLSEESTIPDVYLSDVKKALTGTIEDIIKTKVDGEGENDPATYIYSDPTESSIYNIICTLAASENLELTLESLYEDYLTVYKNNGSATPFENFLIDTFPKINAYEAAYKLYSSTVNSALTVMYQQLAVLKMIEQDPGSVSRLLGSSIQGYSEEATRKLQADIANIRDIYLNQTSDKLNEDLQGLSTFEDLVDIKADMSQDEKLSIILHLLIDQYNQRQANSIQSYINQYGKESNTSENDDANANVQRLIKEIERKENVYNVRKSALNQEKAVYEAQKAIYEKELTELEESIESLKASQITAEEAIKKANETKEYMDRTAVVRDSVDLFNRIKANEVHQKNANILLNYLIWVENTQDDLQQQIGQVYTDVTNNSDYASLMLKYINIYEKEIFAFLHKFDALEVDLDKGFDDIGGIDWLYPNLNKYSLKSYENIFFLTDGRQQARLNTIGNNTSLTPDNSEHYEILENHLSSLLLYNDMLNINKESEEAKIRIGMAILTPSYGITPPYIAKLMKFRKFTQHDVDNLCAEIASNDLAILTDEEKEILQSGNLQELSYKFIQEDLKNKQDNDEVKDSLDQLYKIIENIQNDLGDRYPCLYDIEDYDYSQNFVEEGKDRHSILREVITTDIIDKTRIVELPYYMENEEKIYFKFMNATNSEYYYYSDDMTSYNELVNVEYNKTISSAALNTAMHNILDETNQETRIIWLAKSDPIYLDYYIHDNLYDYNNENSGLTLDREGTLQFNLNLTFKDTFDETLGLLIYDENENTKEQQNCLTSLRSIEQHILSILNNYFTAYYNFYKTPTGISAAAELSTINKKINENTELKAYWKKIYDECLMVKNTQDSIELSEDAGKRIQLLALLETAYDNYMNYKAAEEYWIQIRDDLLKNNADLKQYTFYLSIIPQTKAEYQEAISKFNSDYTEYKRKVQHLLKLLYNNNPYGENLPADIIHTPALLESYNETNMYNFGLAYAIDKYKNGLNAGDEPISFSDILEKKNILNEIFNINYPLVHKLIPEYNESNQLITSYNITLRDHYLIEDPDSHLYTKYFYVDTTLWEEDLQNGIYYIDYPSLLDFENIFEFIKIPNNFNYDNNINYYTLDNDKYIINNEINEENFNSFRQNLYIKSQNGGLKTFVQYLINEPNNIYLNSVQKVYEETLDLYVYLLQQALGDETEVENLTALYNQYMIQIKELEEQLSHFSSDGTFNHDENLDKIIQKLAEYLRILTVKYITEVEGRYGVI